jgi:pyruvate kinase
MCEAAHVPVVWATQVLETLAREGAPTRSEETDAAMSERAECVMLNKGPYVVQAVEIAVRVVCAPLVLETLAGVGAPTRSEVTDAAMSERAECVMLNKGPYVVQAVAALEDILVRMEGHQRKKNPLLRPLSISTLEAPYEAYEEAPRVDEATSV